MSPATAAFALHFHDWNAGHHGITPAQIPVHSVDQALLILSAISNGISQPGSARAQLLSAEGFVDFYICEDHVDPRELSSEVAWEARPLIVYGPQAERDVIRRPANSEALMDLYWRQAELDATDWDGSRFLDALGFACTSLTLEELQALDGPAGRPAQGGPRRPPWYAPPVFITSAEVLEALRQWHTDEGSGEVAP